MAGDWLKIEKATPHKPEILRIAYELGIDPDRAFGICFRFWSWCDDNLKDGNAIGVTDVMLNALLKCDGFATALINVGWLRVRNGSLEVPNYDRHLSENAKKRGLSQQRTAKSRSRSCNGASVTDALPEKRREEKRRDITLSPSASDGPRIPPELLEHWNRWTSYIYEKEGEEIGSIEAEQTLKSLLDRGIEKAKQDIEFSIVKRCKTIRDSSNDYDKKQNLRSRDQVKEVAF